MGEGVGGTPERRGCNPLARLWHEFFPPRLTPEREREIEVGELLAQVKLPPLEGIETFSGTPADINQVHVDVYIQELLGKIVNVTHNDQSIVALAAMLLDMPNYAPIHLVQSVIDLGRNNWRYDSEVRSKIKERHDPKPRIKPSGVLDFGILEPADHRLHDDTEQIRQTIKEAPKYSGIFEQAERLIADLDKQPSLEN